MKNKKKKNKNSKNAFQQYMDKYHTGGTVHNHPHKESFNNPFYGQFAKNRNDESQFNANPWDMYDWNNQQNYKSSANIPGKIETNQIKPIDISNLQIENNLQDPTGFINPVEESSKEKITAPKGWWGDFQQMGNMSKQDMKMADTPITKMGGDANGSIAENSKDFNISGEGGMETAAMINAATGAATETMGQIAQLIEVASQKYGDDPTLTQTTNRQFKHGGFLNPNMFTLGGLTQNPTVEVEGEEVIETPDGQLLEVKGPSHDEGGVVTNDIPAGSMVYSKEVEDAEGVSMAARKKDREKYWSTIADKFMSDSQNPILKSTMERVMEKHKKAEQIDAQKMDEARAKDATNNLFENLLNLNDATSKLSASNKKYKKGGKTGYKYKNGGKVKGKENKENVDIYKVPDLKLDLHKQQDNIKSNDNAKLNLTPGALEGSLSYDNKGLSLKAKAKQDYIKLLQEGKLKNPELGFSASYGNEMFDVSGNLNTNLEDVGGNISANVRPSDKLSAYTNINFNQDPSARLGVDWNVSDKLNLGASADFSNQGINAKIKGDYQLNPNTNLNAYLNYGKSAEGKYEPTYGAGLNYTFDRNKETPNYIYKHGGMMDYMYKNGGKIPMYNNGGPILKASEYQDADAVVENIFGGDIKKYQQAVADYIKSKNISGDLGYEHVGSKKTGKPDGLLGGEKSKSRGFLKSDYGKDFLESATGFKTINYSSGYPEGMSPFITGDFDAIDAQYNPAQEGYFYDDRELENIQGAGLYDPNKLQYKQYPLTEFGEGEGLFRTFPEEPEGKPWATDWADYMLNPSTKSLPRALEKEKPTYTPEDQTMDFTTGDELGMLGTLAGGLSPMMTTMMQQAATPKNVSFYETYMDRALGTMEGQKGFLGQQKTKALRDAKLASDTFNRDTRRNVRSINTLRALGQVSNAQEQKMTADIYNNYAQQMMGLTGQIAQMQGQQDMVKMQGREKADLANRQDLDAFFTSLNQDQRNLGTMMQKMGKDLNVKQSDLDFLSILPDLNKYGLSYKKKQGGGWELYDTNTGKTASESKKQQVRNKANIK